MSVNWHRKAGQLVFLGGVGWGFQAYGGVGNERKRFWVDIIGYEVEWRPDPDNVYLRGGRDNLAMHRSTDALEGGRLDHVGLAVAEAGDVDAWAAHLGARGVGLKAAPKTHRDGSRSLYFHGPEGLLVQIIHHVPMTG